MYYWQISDGRIWSASAAKFIESGEGLDIVELTSNPGVPADAAFLRATVLFYGYPLGDEIKNRLDKIQDIQSGYAPQLTGLQEAKAGAEMRDDADDVAEIKAEYVALLQEMNQKIQAVPHDEAV